MKTTSKKYIKPVCEAIAIDCAPLMGASGVKISVGEKYEDDGRLNANDGAKGIDGINMWED